MKRRRAGESKPCKSPHPPENINMYYPHGDTNIGISESVDPAYLSPSLPSSSCKTPSFMQLLLCEEDDIIDLSSSEENVPSPYHGVSLMISGENEPSSSSSHPQPIHLPALIDKEAIGEHLLSQSLLDSVLRCLPSDLLVSSNNIVTSQHSHPQAVGDKEDERLIKEKARSEYRYLVVLNCKIPIAVKEFGQPVGSEAPNGNEMRMRQDVQSLKKAGGKASSWEKPILKTRTTKDGRPVNEAKHLKETTEQQKASEGCGIESDVFTQVMGQDTHRHVSTHGCGPCPSDSSGPSPTETEAMKVVSADAELKQIREKLASIEQTCAQMASQMATIMSLLTDLQKKLPEKDGAPSEPSQGLN